MGISTYKKPENIKNAENQPSSIKVMARKYFALAEDLRNNNKYKESVENYLNSILIDRNNIVSFLGAALSYKNLRKYNKAIVYLKKAEDLDPYDKNVQKELALCYIINGDFDSGLKHLINAISLEPDNLDIQMQLALVHEMIDEEEMALMIYQKIIETDENYIRAYIQKATLYMHINDYVNSAIIFKKIIKLKPDYYRAFLALGICYEKLSNYSAAKRYYKKYIDKNPLAKDYFDIKNRLKELSSRTKTNVVKLRIVQ